MFRLFLYKIAKKKEMTVFVFYAVEFDTIKI